MSTGNLALGLQRRPCGGTPRIPRRPRGGKVAKASLSSLGRVAEDAALSLQYVGEVSVASVQYVKAAAPSKDLEFEHHLYSVQLKLQLHPCSSQQLCCHQRPERPAPTGVPQARKSPPLVFPSSFGNEGLKAGSARGIST